MYNTVIQLKLLVAFLSNFVVLNAVIFSPSVSSEEVPIKITNGEYKPYSSNTLRHGGVLSHIVEQAFAIEGQAITFEFLPWNRSYEIAKSGYMSGSCCWYQTEERSKYFYFSEPLMADKVVFMHRKDFDFDWSNMQDLKGLSIGVVGTQSYGSEFDKAAKGGVFPIQRAYKEELNLKKIIGKRIDLTPINIEVGYALIYDKLKAKERNQITHHQKHVTIDYLRLLLSKKNKDNEALMNTFNRGLRKLKANGTFDKLIADSREGKYEKVTTP